jgi:restriction system protein
LQGKRAKKGIFITTSDFTAEAHKFVDRIETKIILISGQQLVELMWEHGVGLDIFATYEIKRLNMGYFSE